MHKLVYFDYCALVLLLVLLITTIYRKMTRGRINRAFLALIIVSLFTCIFDISAITLDNMGAGNIVAKYTFHALYILTHTLLPATYVSYLFALTDTWHIIRRHRVLDFLLYTPAFIGFLLIALNPINHFIFFISTEGVYSRATGLFSLYFITGIYFVFGYCYLFVFRKLFTKSQLIFLLLLFPFTVIASVVQFFMPNYIVELFVSTIAITCISMTIQKPENMVDPDTGLLRLSAYVSCMEKSRITKKPMEIIMLNISNYQTIFDMLGYDKTNHLLINIAQQLNSLNRRQHLSSEIYYLGQGKYRIIIDEGHFSQTAEIARLICRALQPNIALNQMELTLLAHVCIARYPEDIDNIDSLLAFGTDLNTYPHTGQVMLAADLFQKKHYELIHDLDRIIEQALVENTFEVYYQPIYSVNEGRFNSAEALLRLRDDNHGFIPPDVFIPAAEKSGAIHKIGSFVIEEVCKFISSDDYPSLGLDYIEINLSVAQCMHSNLAKDILRTLDMYNISPNQINLEITETAASYSQNIMIDNLNQLTAAGVGFSLDDYGTGYSNIRRIASLPLQLIKLDKSFTNVTENPKLLVILENTVRMIKAMNLQIVVEGIETAEMVKQFSDLECEYIQGYYYSRPIPKQEFVAFIQSTQK